MPEAHEVIAVADQPHINNPQVTYINKDIGDIDASSFPSERVPDVCLHLAWRNGFIHNAPSHLEELPSHYAFLRRMAKLGTKQICALGSVHEDRVLRGVLLTKARQLILALSMASQRMRYEHRLKSLYPKIRPDFSG
ncbi:hypothetical protein ACTMU2_39250 [Cupriavidus basilensis]